MFRNSETREAFLKVDRANFMISGYRHLAYWDCPMNTGYEQTISQPSTVAKMLNLLEVHRGCSVLDVGCGSGYTTALLSEIVGDGGSVVAVDRIPELVKLTEVVNAKRKNVKTELADKHWGFPEDGPYDRILVSALADEIVPELLAQLKFGGTMVIPVKVDKNVGIMKRIRKTPAGISVKDKDLYTFVPLIPPKK